ncbi:hypothetical protein K8R61_02600, partial [bacterium]|nr:hypothetical protein [bacterium]
KIFEEIKSPFSQKSVILFGLNYDKTNECCLKPKGVFINNKGKLGSEYDILGGAGYGYIDNVKWESDNKISYDFIGIDPGGKQIIKKYLYIKK